MHNTLLTSALFTLMVAALPAAGAQQPAGEFAAISTAVEDFIFGADQRDEARVAGALHDQFRLVLNGFTAPGQLTTMDKSAYLAGMQAGKIGGQPRSLEVTHLERRGNVANVTVLAASTALRFTTYLSLVEMPDGRWQIIHVLNQAEKR